ncbi:MAG: lysoplasmalogenase [Erysipelotrichaceae bacterium]|nr:lysoplasmalogenase [Erysipelotrichaceae bacterium]
MKILSIILFIISTAIHLYASLKKDKPLRNKSKPFIIFSLLLFYCFSAEPIKATVVLALIFSWIGDILLIPDGIKWFTAGGISFMISHFFFVLSYMQDVNFSKINPIVVAVLGIFFFTIVFFIFRRLKPLLPKALFYPMYLYLLINGAMNCFAIFRYLSNKDLAGIITVIGAALFFVSDCSLFFVRFDKNSRLKTHFLVMLTYSIGEFLIVLGLILK